MLPICKGRDFPEVIFGVFVTFDILLSLTWK